MSIAFGSVCLIMALFLNDINELLTGEVAVEERRPSQDGAIRSRAALRAAV